jgi:uncharacterized protein RhaS with RHS repeats
MAFSDAQIYHYKARAYDPVMGRFLQTDPIGQQDDPNLYAYVKDDPVDHVDSTGELCVGSFPNADFCDRSARYAALASRSDVRSRTDFFSAATIVTSALADAAAVSTNAERGYLQGLSGQLETQNRSFLAGLTSGNVAQNNRAFVEFEQSNVQGSLDRLQKNNPDLFKSLVKDINGRLNDAALGSLNKGLNPTFQKALSATIDQLGRPIDFSKKSDRVALGNNEIKAANGPGPAACPVGTRVC